MDSHSLDFENIVDIAPFPILIHRMGEMKYVNVLILEMFGYTKPEEMVGKNLIDLVYPEDRQLLIDTIKKGMEEGTRNSIINMRMITATGLILNTEAKSSTISFRGEECRLVVAYNYDYKTKVEEELRDKTLLLQKIAEVIPDSIMVVESKTRKVLFENKSILQQLGYSDEDIQGKNQFDFLAGIIHPDDIPKLLEARKTLSETSLPSQYVTTEYRMRNKENKWRWMLGRSTIFKSGADASQRINFGIIQDITYLKEVEQQLLESKLFAEKITNTIPNHVSIYDTEIRSSVFENYPFSRLLGYTPENAPKDIFEFFEPTYLAEARTHFGQMLKLKDGEIFEATGRYITVNGNIKHMLVRSTPFLRNEKNEVKHLLASITDVSEIIAAELKIERSEKIYKTIAESIPNGSVVVFDKDLKFTLAEGSLLERQGFKREDIVGKSAYDPLNKKTDWSYFIPYFENVLKGKSFTLEIPDRGFVYHILMKPLFDEAGNIYGGMSITLDVKDIKDAQTALTHSEETRKAILLALPDIVFQVDITGRITDFYSNETYRKFLEEMKMVGKNASEFIPQIDFDNLVLLIKKAIETQVIQNYEYTHVEKGSALHYEFRVSRLNDTNAIVMVRDMTNLKNTSEQLDMKITELSQKNVELEKYITSNTELEKFAYIASHDLREPIRSIVGFTQLLQKRFSDKEDPETKEFLENIINGAQRMNTLVHGLLDYSRVSANSRPFNKADMNEILNKVRSDLKAIIEDNEAEIIVGKLPELVCDELQLRQLFQNLISNSIKFRKWFDKPVIKISVGLLDDKWLFKIEDNGIGLEMKYKEKVFQIFSRLHTTDKYQGSGIGLAVCKKIVDRHGGDIWLESEVGKGTTFYFTIATNT